MASDPTETVAFLSRRMKVLEKGLAVIELLPGAKQATLPDGTSLIDLQVRLRAFDEQLLPALRQRFFAGAVSEQALKQLLTILEGIDQEHAGQLSLASDRLKALTQTYQDYLVSMSADTATPTPVSANSGANQVSGETQGQDSFLSQLLDFARSTADQPYRQKWVNQISQSRLEVGRLERGLTGRLVGHVALNLVGLLEHRVRIHLLADLVDELHARELEELDGLLELRRHDQ